jgi:hypothetical protein
MGERFANARFSYLSPPAGRGKIALAIRVRGYRSIPMTNIRGCKSPSPQPSPHKQN